MGIVKKKQCIITLFLPSPFKWMHIKSEWLTNSKYNRQDSVGKLRGVCAHCFAWVVVMSCHVFHIHRQKFIMILIIIKKITNKYIIIGPLQLGPVTWPIVSQNNGIQPLIYKRWKTKTQLESLSVIFSFFLEFNTMRVCKRKLCMCHPHTYPLTGYYGSLIQ